MLEEKLRQASENSARNRRLAVLGGAAVAIIVALLIYISTTVDFRSAPGTVSDTMTDTAPTPDVVLRPALLPQQVTPPPSTSGIAPDDARAQFVERLGAYEAGLEATVAAANLDAWAPEKRQELTAIKEAALSDFATGRFVEALNGLIRLEGAAQAVLDERDRRYAEAMAAAQQALDEDRVTDGILQVTKALTVKPEDGAATALRDRLDALPKILALLKQAGIARTENDVQKEYVLLTEAYNLDTSRADLKQRLQALAEVLAERQFSAKIDAGMNAVRDRDLATAQKNIRAAATLDPGRPEIGVLRDAIAALAAELDLEKVVQGGQAAVVADDWQTARTIFSDGLTRHPDSKALQDGLQLADGVLGAQGTIGDFIKRPERLSAANVRAQAQDALVRASVFKSYSPTVAGQIGTLKRLMVSMNRNVPVQVTSDGQTFVSVRGVGKVGQVTAKTIELKPGRYTFEGMRQGYRSKLVEVQVPPDGRAVDVVVICDEPI